MHPSGRFDWQGVLAYSNPLVQEGVAPAEAEGEVIASAQRHDSHSWRRLQLQLSHCL